MLTIACVCGARPNFIKIAPLVEAFRRTGRLTTRIIHTGQHYDDRMSRSFFADLGIPEPDVNLGVGSGSHAVQTAEIMTRFEPVLLRAPDRACGAAVSAAETQAGSLCHSQVLPGAPSQRPDWVVVVGDVNSTIACALTACKLGVKVAHVEAGLRSFDPVMPEEINRLLTDAISDLLFVSEPSGLDNLRREGVPDHKVHFVGNVMIDTLLRHRARADQSPILAELGLRPRNYVVVTLHRPSNVDDTHTFGQILDAFAVIARELPIVFPMHPRTREDLVRLGLAERAAAITGLALMEPLGYIEFLKLMADAAVVITDSGGIQEETTILGVPCLTLRTSTERPVTITHGTNRLAPPNPPAILHAFRQQRDAPVGTSRVPPLWDGRAAERIADIFLQPA